MSLANGNANITEFVRPSSGDKLTHKAGGKFSIGFWGKKLRYIDKLNAQLKNNADHGSGIIHNTIAT